ncbi:hypothetical protein LTR62_008299 [Meristemomyces frigidus]|uniref:Secreted protein n=1 Tax=Meristemomyces frigidus TaxID=1508187 RepID=A0AAN7YLY7_9PEZI|nr:hypothetical protein LTR62_008299 [Meristemomyces frigidus]
MFRRYTFWLFASSLYSTLSQSSPEHLYGPKTEAGTFNKPAAHVRPKFRYWIPDASVDPVVVSRDVGQAAKVGMGGMELLGYYLYGGPPSNGAGRGTFAPVDWATYGFGTQSWDDVFQMFVQATKDNDLILDFAIGPNQGTGVPAPKDCEGLSVDIAAYNVTVPLGGSFDGVLPGWGAGSLHAVVTGLVTNISITLSASSLTDVTSNVTSDGRLKIDFVDYNTTGLNYTIFAIYMLQTDYRAQDGPLEMGGPQTAPTSWLQNGSWAADHFSALGAHTITNFWSNYILTNSTRTLLSSIGMYAWEDSVEIEANVYWTRNLSQAFYSDHGYSLAKYLPILFHRNGHYRYSNPSTWWVTDEADAGNGHIADYRATLGKGYVSYLTALNTWAETYLGMGFSAQMGYNLPVDMLSVIPSVEAPECESLDFSDLIDGYRQYVGPAHLAQRRIVSSECGAVRGEGYVQTLPELLWKVKRAYAGGLNQLVFHGYPYSGQYGNTTWPVFTTFNYQYSSMHGPHEPAWEDYHDQMAFVSRSNWVMQSGVPQVDIAIWQKVTDYPGHVQLPTYAPTDLEAAGYTYEYLTPENFALAAAKVVNGIFAPNAQAFGALVARANDSLTVPGVEKLIEYAEQGLPTILAGGVPSTYIDTYDYTAIAQREVQKRLQNATTLPNVHVTTSYLVADTLSLIGIQPRTSIVSTTPQKAILYTAWRHDAVTNIDYVYVYNDAMYSPQGQGTVEAVLQIKSTGIPYEMNAWTGGEKRYESYNATANGTLISVKLAGNQSTIFAFHCAEDQKDEYSAARTTTFEQPYTLENWTLVVEHWDPPGDLYNITAGAEKHNTTHYLPSLVSWQLIPGLQKVSGRGYYSTTFPWSCDDTTTGTILDFGWIYHTLKAVLNGHALPPLDVTAPRVDVRPYLVEGQNKLEVVVATPLGNVLIPIWDQLQTSGEGPGSADSSTVAPPRGDYGLQSAITLTRYWV